MPEGRRRIRAVWWVVGACVVALVALFVYAQVRGWTPSRVERTVNRELPLGSTRAQVEAFLDAQAWSHSYNENADVLRYHGQEVGLRGEQLGGVVFANVPDPNLGMRGNYEGTITVLFFIGRDGRLIRSYVRVWLFSL